MGRRIGAPMEVYYFEQTSVIFERDERGAVARVDIQCIDAYRRQRELTIAKVRTPGAPMDDPSSWYWSVSAYCHPWHVKHDELWDAVEVSEGVARRLMDRLEDLTTHWPTLLFNETSDRAARCEGFVHWHETLTHGAAPSVKQLP